ncbi:MAG: Gfo/Idh/MocA family oxidoreductase, partial [Candidatus Omnitrophica bacterium]|nr:Gfo/Idh/MocA family oxidoreductase [Candidatus Omnitrophota bacterium]
MSQKIKFAIIGASGVAPGHIKAIQSNPHAELVYLYSRDAERSKSFAKQYGLIAAATYEQILSDKNIDAVDIVTEPSRHAELALMAIQNKKHVLIEKPLETDMLKAQELVTESSKVSTITSVISQKRFEPVIKAMKGQLDNRISGDIFLAEVKMFWHRTSDYYAKGNCWRSHEGNVLVNQAIHWIDIAIWFFGFPLKIKSLNLKVKKEISCYDTAICCLEMPNNILFNL